jgi:hypothetical protein
LHVCWHKKKFLHTTFFENTISKLFIAAQTFRVSSIFDIILSITVQSIFAIEPIAWACWEGILLENIKKNKKQQQQHYFVFLLGVTENGITQKTYF